MIPNNERRHVESFLPGETKEFTIRATGKAFKVLIDGLYSDKIKSIIRELWTNAYDAHIGAGKPSVPFECSLPGVGVLSAPEFSVRDYGTSMDHETIMTRYSTLFDSTKDGTNEQVGYLGLGSKSPFAYTDSFTVTAWLDGEKRVYAAVLNENGVPSISLMGRTDSDEPQGLKVSFSASPQDAYLFRKAATTVAVGFDVRPLVDGVSPPRPKYEGTGWKLFDEPLGASVMIRQGCVIYPYSGKHRFEQVGGLGLLVDVPIGTCEVTASREALSLTPATEGAIKTHVDAAITAIRAHFDAVLAKSPSLLAASKVYLTNHEFRSLTTGTWRGQKVIQFVKLPTPVLKAKAPSNNYSPASIDTVNVMSVDAFKLLVDDGTPIVRRRARIAAYVNGGNRRRLHDGSSLTGLAAPPEVDDIRKALELRDDQIILLKDTVDPGPTPRTAMNYSPKQVPTKPFVWLIRSRSAYTLDEFGVVEDKGAELLVANLKRVYRDEMGGADAIEYFTPRQAKVMGLPDSRRLDRLVADHVRTAKVGVALKQQAVLDARAGEAQEFMNTISRNYNVDHYAREAMQRAVYGDIRTVKRAVSEDVMSVAHRLKLVVDNSTNGGKVSDVIKDLTAKYPLLFDSDSRSKVMDYYINETNNAQKGGPS